MQAILCILLVVIGFAALLRWSQMRWAVALLWTVLCAAGGWIAAESIIEGASVQITNSTISFLVVIDCMMIMACQFLGINRRWARKIGRCYPGIAFIVAFYAAVAWIVEACKHWEFVWIKIFSACAIAVLILGAWLMVRLLIKRKDILQELIYQFELIALILCVILSGL